MAKLLVIGCGGVAQVAIQKCCQNDGLFTELVLVSRTKAKCDALKEKLAGKTKTVISTAEVDADNVAALCVLIRDVRAESGPAVSGPFRDGGLPRVRRGLYRHRELRAGEHRRSRMARDLRKALQGAGLLRLL